MRGTDGIEEDAGMMTSVDHGYSVINSIKTDCERDNANGNRPRRPVPESNPFVFL